jgi:hypothetical protein
MWGLPITVVVGFLVRGLFHRKGKQEEEEEESDEEYWLRKRAIYLDKRDFGEMRSIVRGEKVKRLHPRDWTRNLGESESCH